MLTQIKGRGRGGPARASFHRVGGTPMMRPMVALLLLLAAAPKARAEVPPERWLLQWVDEAAKPRFMAGFHAEFPGSPHRSDSERFEMTARCYEASQAGPEKVAPVLVALRARLEKGRDTCLEARKTSCAGVPEAPLPQRARAATVLGCLRDAASVEALATLAAGTDEVLGKAAIGALGYFGNRDRRAGFLVFGGQYRAVVFPAAHAPRATAALVDTYAARPDRRRDVLDALETHALPEVEEVLRKALEAPLPPPAGAPDDGEFLRSAALAAVREQRCLRCVPWVLPLLERGGVWEREEAVRTLGDLPDPRSVVALVRRLTDAEEQIREEAQAALLLLSGVHPPLGSTRVAREDGPLLQAGWTRRWGAQAERYDPRRAAPPRAWEPGIH